MSVEVATDHQDQQKHWQPYTFLFKIEVDQQHRHYQQHWVPVSSEKDGSQDRGRPTTPAGVAPLNMPIAFLQLAFSFYHHHICNFIVFQIWQNTQSDFFSFVVSPTRADALLDLSLLKLIAVPPQITPQQAQASFQVANSVPSASSSLWNSQ